MGRRARQEQLRRRRAQLVGLGGFLAAASLPWVLFSRVIGDIVSEFRWDLKYLVAEWSPWALIAAGIAFFVPVALSIGRDPESRFYPQARAADFGWGITLYVLGVALASQVAQLDRLTSS
jgi:hypothetical protein